MGGKGSREIGREEINELIQKYSCTVPLAVTLLMLASLRASASEALGVLPGDFDFYYS